MGKFEILITHLYTVCRDESNKNQTTYIAQLFNPNSKVLSDHISFTPYRAKNKINNYDNYLNAHYPPNKKARGVTALFKTIRKDSFIGNYKDKDGNKTLLLFFFTENRSCLRVVEFPYGYYPDYPTVQSLIRRL